MTVLDHALFYAHQGWQVFPLKPKDKVPVVKWVDVATTEENMIKGWWEFQPDANVGIMTGAKSRITVLDVDKGHDGYDSLSDLIVKYGALPETPVVKTGNGGEHIYFNYVEGTRNSAGKIGKGLDIRSEGGYVVGGGSIHPNGNRYEWVVKPSQYPLADMPEWMIELLKANTPQIEVPAEGFFPQGQKHNILLSFAGSMHRRGMSTESIYQALLKENELRCSPPHDIKDIRAIAESMKNYPVDRVYDLNEVKEPPRVPATWDVIDTLEAEIKERQKNPCDVWGIHYAWRFLSLVTGGKHAGELIILAGEPGVGKSWWAHQDALCTAIGNPSLKIPSTPVLVWSGEMPRKQVYRRFFEMLGVPKRNMLRGAMSADDWQTFNEAKAVIMNSPIYVSDAMLDLKSVRGLLEREIGEHGIKQVIFDYDWLINAKGVNEIEKSQNISLEMKQLSRDLNISTILISSVNKTGMDNSSANVTKSNVSGSGKKLHDADVIYIATKFNEDKNNDLNIMPVDYQKIMTLHIAKGRELDYHVPGGAINYMRETPKPSFRELKNIERDVLPVWL